jgi:hypothetical protein
VRTRAPDIAPAALAGRIVRVLEEELGARLEPSELTAEERRWAERRAPFYSSPAFLRRR